METITSTCAACGVAISPRSETKVVATQKSGPLTPCLGCVDKAERRFASEKKGANLSAAIGLGRLAGLVSALLWFGVVVVTEFRLGFVALGAGWLVAQAVMVGPGNRRGGALSWISLAFTAAAMLLAEYLIVRYYAARHLAEEGVVDVPLLLPIALGVTLIFESVKSDALAVAFWLIALTEAAGLPRKRRLRCV